MSKVTDAIAIEELNSLDDTEVQQRITSAKEKLADEVVILGHHYQRDEVFKHADFSGDSLKLSHQASQSNAKYIVFCGVHFMAEVADILSRPEQISIIPDTAAGCSMADMASLAKVEKAWQELATVIDPDEEVIPVTYINSAANLKAFCGRHGGIVCTSSNAHKVLEWAWEKRAKVLFFPDQHLGRNTADTMGMSLEEMSLWDFNKPTGGLTKQQIKDSKLLLWNGFCSVHQMFLPKHIDDFKKKYPETLVISHPESSFEVCQKSDIVGSTEKIIKSITDGEHDARWLVGTELNLVNRLRDQLKERGTNVHFMSPNTCVCSTMFRIDPAHLLWTLESLVQGRVVNQIKVSDDDTAAAKVALDNMLQL